MTTGALRERRHGRQQLTARWLLQESLTARGAALIIASFTLVMTIAGGVAVRAVDRKDFHSLGEALWWSLQTVTTVGYGDVVPSHPSGRLIAAVVMLVGLGFLAVITASVTASLIEHARRRLMRSEQAPMQASLDAIEARLAAIEAALRERRDAPGDGHGAPRP